MDSAADEAPKGTNQKTSQRARNVRNARLGAPAGGPREEPLTEAWRPALRELCAEIRTDVRAALWNVTEGQRDDVAAIVGRGAGDATFAIDVVAEDAVLRWFEAVACWSPLSLMTEDVGWRHRGPRPGAAPGTDSVELPDFDHGGPRIALDPIDGTRNVMHDLRSAWVVVSFAGPGPRQPRMTDISLGLLSEIPDTRTRIAREFDAVQGEGASVLTIESHPATGDASRSEPEALRVDEDPRLDRGYFPFFGYEPDGRRQAQLLAARVIGRVGSKDPSFDPTTVLDDQYISSGGQLALLCLGTYRAIIDARPSLNERHGAPQQTAKPYDVAGAILIAREAGCTVTRANGSPIDFPIDVTTHVEFAAFHNEATREGYLEELTWCLDHWDEYGPGEITVAGC